MAKRKAKKKKKSSALPILLGIGALFLLAGSKNKPPGYGGGTSPGTNTTPTSITTRSQAITYLIKSNPSKGWTATSFNGMGDAYLIAWAGGLLNGSDLFTHQGNTYSTVTGMNTAKLQTGSGAGANW